MGIENSNVIFDLVFFIVITSVLVQGWSIKYFAKLLNLAAPIPKKSNVQLEFTSNTQDNTDLIEIIVPHNASVIGKQVVELNFPENSRIVLITRDEKNIVPSGGTMIESGDIISILLYQQDSQLIREIFS
jgi:cell volume regulation protein A